MITPRIGAGGLRISGDDVISDVKPGNGIDLLRRYRTLCEASGIARANRLPLAAAVLAEIADLEESLIALLAPLSGRTREPPGHPSPLASTSATSAETATVFTDGAAEGNPGPGGYCAILRIPGRPDRELSGAEPHSTNNKMELMAAIVGLKSAIE